MDVVELTTIIEKNKNTRFSIQDLGEEINYGLSITEKTSEGVYWLDFHHHNETDTAKNWATIYIYILEIMNILKVKI